MKRDSFEWWFPSTREVNFVYVVHMASMVFPKHQRNEFCLFVCCMVSMVVTQAPEK